MTLPSQAEIEVPLLEEIEKAGGAAKPNDLYARLVRRFPAITEDDLFRALPRGGHSVWATRVQWVRQKLVVQGEIDRSVRGLWAITQAGRRRLAAHRDGRPYSPPAKTQAGTQETDPAPAFPTATPLATKGQTMNAQRADAVRDAIHQVAEKARRHRDRNLGESNTKATLIEPILDALGWNIRDPEEVDREFKAKRRDKPVDYALKLLRKPRLFIEAKGLGMNLSDRKWISQILSYATVAGVEWCVLTDGDEYRFYKATAPVDAEEKMFRRVRLSDGDEGEAVETLSLISRANLEENLLDRYWQGHYVDRRVRQTLRSLMEGADRGLIRLIRSREPALQPKEIGDSIQRLEVTPLSPLHSPAPMPGAAAAPAQPAAKRKAPKPGRKPTDFGVTVADLIRAGVLKPPLPLFRKYKGVVLEAVLGDDGSVEFRGQRYASLSTAAEQARGTVTGRKMNTNGWIFWQYRDESGKSQEIIAARKRFLAGG